MGGNGGWQSTSNNVNYTPLPGAGQSADPAFPAAKGKNGKPVAPNYPMPANWPQVQVGTKNLKVNADALMTAQTNLKGMAGELEGWLNTYAPDAANAAGGVGAWPAALQLSDAISTTVGGVQNFVTQLQTAHDDTITALNQSQGTYANTETTNSSNISHLATAPEGWQVQAGGAAPQHNDPFLGDNLSPQAKAAALHLMAMNSPGAQQTWNQPPVDITINQPFKPDNTWQNMDYTQINDYISQTDPGAVSKAAVAYGHLTGTLTDMTGRLASTAQTLSENWSGSGAVHALSNIQMLHQTATDLQTNVFQAGEALKYYGSVLPAFKSSPIPTPSSSLTSVNKAQLEQGQIPPSPLAVTNTQAQTKMQLLNGHIQTSYNAMPAQLNANLPGPPAPPGPQTPRRPGGSGAGGVPPGGGTGGVPPGGGTGGVPPGGGSPTGVPPVSTVPPGGRITTPITVAGGPPTGPPVTSPGPVNPGGPGIPPTTTPPGPVPMPPVTVPTVPGALGGLNGEGGPTLGVPGARLLSTGANGGLGGIDGLGGSNGAAAGEALGANGLGANDGLSVAGEGIGGAAGEPMGSPFGGMGMGGMGGLGGGGSQARTRQSWTSEDQALWNPPGEAALIGSGGGFGGDGMIGGDPAGGIGGLPETGFGTEGSLVSGGSVGGAAGEFGATGTAEGGMFPPLTGGAGLGNQDQNGRARQAWLNEDVDIWADSEHGVPPVIG